MNPDAKERRLAPCQYDVEELDLSRHGMPGFAYTGTLYIEPDPTPGIHDWYVVDTKPHAPPRAFDCIKAAVMADDRLCDFITEASYEAGED
jgi:hypothetical protein